MNGQTIAPSLVKPLELEGEATGWYTRMDEHEPSLLLPFLSEEEKGKAMKIRDVGLSRYAIISRGILRSVLSGYLGLAPSDVVIENEKNGKPVLASSMPGRLYFNVSHSHGVLVIAISENNKVGIDIEKINPEINLYQTAAIAFSPEEIMHLNKSINQIIDFYQIWTAKEAVLKSTGDGFAYPSNDFSVISSMNSSMARQISGAITRNRQCDIHRFSLLGDFTGAVAEIHP